MTDRRLLDKQLGGSIKGFAEVENILGHANSSADLKKHLEQGKRIITTIQKFPFIVDGIADLSDKCFAVIIDEAHSSQSGTAAGTMNQAMGMGDLDETDDPEVKILQAMEARKMRDNASYLAFTATPKNTTLERFGVKQEDGSFLPFHLYSMKQAIEDLFILDFFNATDINILHELKDALDSVAVYEWSEVEDFVSKYFSNVDAQELSPIIDIAADRFNHELQLEDDDKADFKIKAKQFVKIYGQVSSIIDFNIENWERLFWLLKFLIPKLIVIDKEAEAIDELLNAVDLSTYGLERTKLNHSIGLDDSESEVDPQNSNLRGAHGDEGEKDGLEEIIKTFNERWFHGWETTPEDQRVKFVTLSKQVRNHPDFAKKVAKNTNTPTRDLALRKILEDVMSQQRRQELELYKLYAKDDAFKSAFFDTMKRMVDEPEWD